MATKKQTSQSSSEKQSFVVSNCNFTSTPAEGTVECVMLIANAVLENAKALQAAAVMLKPSDTMVRFGN